MRKEADFFISLPHTFSPQQCRWPLGGKAGFPDVAACLAAVRLTKAV